MVHRLASWAALALVAVLAACSAPAAAAGGPLYSVAAYDPARDAAADLAATLERARAEDKRVILEVGGEWCVWCKLLDAYVHDTPGYSARLAREFIIMKVNYSDENENADFLSAYPPAEGYPFMIILSSDGQVVGKQNTGELEKGRGYDDQKMLAFIKQWRA